MCNKIKYSPLSLSRSRREQEKNVEITRVRDVQLGVVKEKMRRKLTLFLTSKYLLSGLIKAVTVWHNTLYLIYTRFYEARLILLFKCLK